MSDQTKAAADELAGYAASCCMRNTLPWMEGLAEKINAYLEATGDYDRVVCHGQSLQTITKRANLESATNDEHN